MIPPTRLGTKKTVLNTFEPLIPRVSAYATKNAMRLMSITDTITNSTVNQN